MKERNYSNLSEALKGLKEIGYAKEFSVLDGNLTLRDEDVFIAPEDATIVDTYRFEGESDPNEMAVIYVIETRQGVKGTLLDAFGLYGDEEVGECVKRMRDIRKQETPTNVIPADSVR